MSAGVLNNEQLVEILFSSSQPAWVPRPSSETMPDIDGSAVDLPLGTKYWVMKASCRPVDSQTLLQLREEHKESGPHDLLPNTHFPRDRVYWIQLACEQLTLPPSYCGRATAKSTIGRLDAMVRLVVDRENEFDKISDGQGGSVFLEVIPITFDLELSPGISLSQIRLIHGDERH